ncbi:uncharacterized protein LOC107044061 [Diachasma alloeum]|uniref:uncharacterized protein LOC107044061 n=1 Tax=Diachasma alloeum TaxID=454923 RepID=UPI0007383511|nr:uncharacterized protein LOC107044061 [Diachasma alloeum]
MLNIGGPKQRRRALLSSVITSVLTHGIAVWAEALQLQQNQRKVGPVYRLSALRVASAFRTVSNDAVCVIAGMMPIEVLAEERRSLFQQKGETSLSPTEIQAEARRKSIERWQLRWSTSLKGTMEDAEHVFFMCPRFRTSRLEWENELGASILPENLVEAMLSSKTAWDATSDFATKVIKELREEERRRKNAV